MHRRPFATKILIRAAVLAALFAGSVAGLPPCARAGTGLVTGSRMTLQQKNAPSAFITASATSVAVASASGSGIAVFRFVDRARAGAPYNNDPITLQAASGYFLVVSSGGTVSASGASASAATVFAIRKVSGSAGLGIADGDVVYFVSPDGHKCGPNSSRQFVCTATWPTSSLFFRIAVGAPAARSQALLDGFGVNTHIDSQQYGYQNLGLLIDNINYLGNGMLKTLRDAPASDRDLSWWPEVAAGTGAKFDAYIGYGPPSVYADELARIEQMQRWGQNDIAALEGGNEEDDPYPVSLGNNQWQAAAFQPLLFQAAQTYGLPAFNISFGAGWGNPTGDYGTVGDLSAVTTYANAHLYPGSSPAAHNAMFWINGDAALAAKTRPVAITEYGWITYPDGYPTAAYGRVSRATQAAYVLEGMLDAWNFGDPYYFYYSLYDDNSGAHGLFDALGNAKPAAVALHNLFALLGDTGAAAQSFTTAPLDYSVAGMPPASAGRGGQEALFQKSDGSFWLALWNEQVLNDPKTNADIAVPPVPVTLALGAAASSITVYDPLRGIAPVATASNAASLAISLPAHPILVKIVLP